MIFYLHEHAHTRLNILTGDWILVSPPRMKLSWQGKVEDMQDDNRPAYDPKCYICPGNTQASGIANTKHTELPLPRILQRIPNQTSSVID